jgi:hypothetical protein
MSTRLASCSCGLLTAEVEGDPLRASVCHCLACQRRTGNVFAAQARFLRSQVRITGTGKEFSRVGDAGTKATFTFCPECGATVYYLIEASPEHIVIPVGAFADPAFPPPVFSVYEDRMHPWVSLTAEMEHLF